MSQGIILYGPPASGKDTITRELTRLDNRYVYFPRLKVGGGRTSGYRIRTEAEVAALADQGDLLYSNERYEATYGVDRPGLDEITRSGGVPVLHLGQIAGITAVIKSYQAKWLVAGLWTSKAETARRLDHRRDARPAERLAAWDATLEDLRSADPAVFSLTLNTGTIEASLAARIIDSCCR